MVKITTRQQFELLVQHMKANPNIARGMRTFGPNKATTEELWKEVAQNLNSCGPPTRTPDEWQRVWIHFKAKLKKKLTQNKRNSMTDGGTSQEVILSPLEQAAADLLQIELTVGNAFGVFEVFDIEEPSETEPNVEIEELKECKQPKMYNIQHTSSKRVNTDDRKVAILQEQADTQTEILNTLKKIEKNLCKKNEMLKEAKECKVKENSFRDRYIKQEVAEDLPACSSQRIPSPWKQMQNLDFLVESMEPASTTGNVCEEMDSSMDCLQDESNSQSISVKTPANKKRRTNDFIADVMIAMKSKYSNAPHSPSKGKHEHFFAMLGEKFDRLEQNEVDDVQLEILQLVNRKINYKN